jgi:enolase
MQINSFDDLEKIERIFKARDPTENLEILGGNVVVATEFAILKTVSRGEVWKFLNNKVKKLPMPLGNCVGGGKHGVNGPDFQAGLHAV